MNTDLIGPLTQSERAYIAAGVTESMRAISEIALDMPPGPVSQPVLLMALMKAYNAGRESK